jgi:hypothetical protein
MMFYRVSGVPGAPERSVAVRTLRAARTLVRTYPWATVDHVTVGRLSKALVLAMYNRDDAAANLSVKRKGVILYA